MSFRIVAAAWAVKGLSPNAKLVLIRLADMANDEGVCWPSMASIARDVEIDRRSVVRIVAALEAAKLVFRSRRARANGSSQSNWLTVLPPDDRRAGDDASVIPPRDGAVMGGDASVIPPVTPVSSPGVTPVSSLEPSLNLQMNLQAEGLTDFQKARLQAGQSVIVHGRTVKAGSPEMQTLRALLRSQDAWEQGKAGPGAQVPRPGLGVTAQQGRKTPDRLG